MSMASRDQKARPVAALVKALALAPFYFGLLTLFAVWPWRLGTPFRLMAPLRLSDDARTANCLRLVLFRLSFRDRWLFRRPSKPPIRISRLKKWLMSPWTETFPSCVRFTRSEMERTGQSGAKAAISIFCNGLVDSYRYANGTFHRDWFDLKRRDDAGNHIPAGLHVFCCYTLSHKLNPQMPLSQYLYDKSDFERVCRAHELPTIPVYAVFDAGKMKSVAPIPNESLFSKPTSLSQGRGTFARWQVAAESKMDAPVFCSDGGEKRSLQALLEQLRSQSQSEPCLLQRLVSNHEAIRELTGVETLCTLRLPTCCFPDGEIRILPLANLKVPVSPDALVVNSAQGGIGYVIDTDTGRLGAGWAYGKDVLYTSFVLTGKKALGFELPYWRETVELCKTAHSAAFSTFPTIGWDVAITPEGPILVETNILWERPMGYPGEVFVGKTAYVDCILSHLSRLWPEQVRF